MNIIPKKENTRLKQIKYLVSKGIVDYKYEISDPDNEYIYNRSRNEQDTRPPHQDLKDAINAFRPYFVKLCRLQDAKSLIERPEFKATGAQKGYLKAYLQETDAMIEVTGVVLSGKDDDRTVKITGIYDGISMNSKRFKFTSDIGFEEDLQDIVTDLENAAFDYVFKGYKGDLDDLD